MKILHRPVSISILFGMVCAVSFIPLDLVLEIIFSRPDSICLALWLYTAVYAVLLCRWSRQKLMPAAYPVLFLFLTAFLVQSIDAFFFLAMAVVSWIRSGLCYHQRRGFRLALELFLSMAGSVFIAVLTPASALAWTLGIWLFFLLQALYFVILDSSTPKLDSQYEQALDPFERASRRAEDILSAARNV